MFTDAAHLVLRQPVSGGTGALVAARLVDTATHARVLRLEHCALVDVRARPGDKKKTKIEDCSDITRFTNSCIWWKKRN